MHRRIATALLILATTATLSAQTIYIPASANVDGANNTSWKTDLQVKARGSDGASFTVELLESRTDNSDPLSLDFTVAAGESLRLVNLIDTEFAFIGTAALRLTTTDGDILASSRTFNDDPAGTYGQTVPSVGEDLAIGHGGVTSLIELSRSPDPTTGFRTNIGFVNLADHSSKLVVDLHSADGAVIGTVTKTLKAFEHRQLNDIFATAGATDVADGYAQVRTDDEDGSFIAYASVVDNGSGDAVFILGQSETETVVPLEDERLVVFESFFRPG